MVNKVQSVDRAFLILELLSHYNEGLGITKISNHTNLHKSTVHRLISSLVQNGFVDQCPTTSNYRITLKMYEIGSRRLKDLDILTASKPYTEKISKILNEVVHLVIREEENIVYIDKIKAENTIQLTSNIGKRVPMYSTSVGKAMLAYTDSKVVEEIWYNTDIKKLTENTIIHFKTFKNELLKVHELGFAVDNEENEKGVKCVGAPIFGLNSEVVGAISVSAPSNRITKKNIKKIGDTVKFYASLISKELGFMETS